MDDFNGLGVMVCGLFVKEMEFRVVGFVVKFGVLFVRILRSWCVFLGIGRGLVFIYDFGL